MHYDPLLATGRFLSVSFNRHLLPYRKSLRDWHVRWAFSATWQCVWMWRVGISI